SPEKFSDEIFRRAPKLFPVSRSIRPTFHQHHAPPPSQPSITAAAAPPHPTANATAATTAATTVAFPAVAGSGR
nr:hypothetical protein [Tanacetum cinerariifolium]